MENEITVWEYIDNKIVSLNEEGRKVTAENYGKAKRCLRRYTREEKLFFADITEEFVSEFNSYLERTKIKKATISFYNRVLRSLYNQAAKEGMVKNAHPFDEVYTKVVPKLTAKNLDTVRSATGEIIRIDSLSNDELVRRYKILQMRYNTLVNKLSAIVGA